MIVCPSDENFALSMYIVHERHFSQRLFNLLMFYLLKFFIAKHHGEQVDWQYIHVKSIIITKEINISNNWFIWIYLHNEEVFNLYSYVFVWNIILDFLQEQGKLSGFTISGCGRFIVLHLDIVRYDNYYSFCIIGWNTINRYQTWQDNLPC